ncbi:MAG TPA: hydrogenase iron-sulfur subunit [bacterium (Candidatus Stahlbacteria)]|nr:hydrogenase iron-sulfur subunit [Candidatus Stahlbacteria bacterium]
MKAFICSCQKRIRLPKIKSDRVEIRYYDDLCSPEGLKFVKENVGKDEPIMIAGCSPMVAERYFSDLHPVYVNIREQASYLNHPQEKVKDLIQAGLSRLGATGPVSRKVIVIESKRLLIIGGGVAGLEAARICGDNGLLVEKRPYLGGTVADLDRLYPEGTPNSHTIIPLINEVLNTRAEIWTDTRIEEIKGSLGNYHVRLKKRKGGVITCEDCGKCTEVCPVEVLDHGIKRKAIFKSPTHPDGYIIDFENCNLCGECQKVCPGEIGLDPDFDEEELTFGGIIVATGLHHFDPERLSEYGYGRYPNVYTHLEFERMIASGILRPACVVVVHCAGSRDERYLDYCSGICCLIGMKEAKLVKDRYPDSEVYICYIDIRVRGEQEYFYRALRELGVKFIAGRPGEIIERDGKLLVRVEDSLSDSVLKIPADAVVLSTGFLPEQKVYDKLPINLDRSRFPNAYDWSSLSVDSPPHGILFAGSASTPLSVPDTILDSRSKASMLLNLLSQDQIETTHPVSVIDDDLCSLCGLCVGTCPYGALRREEKIISDPMICMGCGVCVATCPAGASNLEYSEDLALKREVEAISKKGTIVSFLCRWSAYPAADKAYQIGYPESVRIIRVPCSGRVDPQLVLTAFSLGAKGVLIGGCYPEACHYHIGNIMARRRIRLLKALDGMINPEKLKIEWFGSDEARKFVQAVEDLDRP